MNKYFLSFVILSSFSNYAMHRSNSTGNFKTRTQLEADFAEAKFDRDVIKRHAREEILLQQDLIAALRLQVAGMSEKPEVTSRLKNALRGALLGAGLGLGIGVVNGAVGWALTKSFPRK